MKKYHEHIILVSDQAIPNVIPIADPNIAPKKVTLCVTDAMTEKAALLKKFFETRKIQTEIYSLGDAYDYTNLQEKFFNLAVKRESGKDNIAVNVTGGTKVLTLAAMMSFGDFDCFYVVPEKNHIIMLNPGTVAEIYPIAESLKIEDFLGIYGYNVVEIERNITITQAQSKFFEFLISNYKTYHGYIRIINALASQAAENGVLYAKPSPYPPDLQVVLDKLQACGAVVSHSAEKVLFNKPSGLEFCNGIWFEYYMYLQLARLKNELPLQDLARSVMFKRTSDPNVKNEMDIVFLYKNSLFYIECKTSKLGDPAKAKSIIDKLDSLINQSGTFTIGGLASFLDDLNSSEKKRANDDHIKCFVGESLRNIQLHLTEWITTKNKKTKA